MMLLAVGLSYRTAPVELREALSLQRQELLTALKELSARYGCEVVILSTCNRVEIYLGRLHAEVAPDADLLTEFLAEFHNLEYEKLRPVLYARQGVEVINHLFSVAGSLDSLVLGEGQIAGQVKQAYELAREAGTVGPLLHALFQHARMVAKRIHTETGITQGKVSVSSLAVDYLRQVFDRFEDKTVLVIGAGKMGELTLRQLQGLKPRQILVTNRNLEKAMQVAAGCGGKAVPFAELDQAMARADIILSTTGAPEPIVSLERFERNLPHRQGRHVAIVDIAVPRDFDPRIADLDLVDLMLNVDDLKAVRDKVLKGRLKYVEAAEAIVRDECSSFLKEWTRRRTGPAIARLSQDWDQIRQQVQAQCLAKLNGKLTPEDQAVIEGAFKLLQNRLLHAPIAALREEAHHEGGNRLLDAIYKLFRLSD